MNPLTKSISILFVIALTLITCGKKSDDSSTNLPVEEEGNQALYSEVMKIHDEVMPKMNDIYSLKEELKNKIATNPDMPEAEKNEIENKILRLDSANEGMMVWMRQFNPVPDSEGEEKAREYLENEMEKVNKVREDMLSAIEYAKNGNQ